MSPYELEAKGKLGVLDEGQLQYLCLVYLCLCLVCPLFAKRDLSLNLNLVR